MKAHDEKIVAKLVSWNECRQITVNRLLAVEAMQKFKRIKLSQGETVADLISEGRR